MINTTINELKKITEELKNAIILDIEDVKKANHASLVERNYIKTDLMEELTTKKQKLNEELSTSYKNGDDISISVSTPSWLNYNEQNKIIFGTASWENIGTYEVTIIASDNKSKVEQKYSIVVQLWICCLKQL